MTRLEGDNGDQERDASESSPEAVGVAEEKIVEGRKTAVRMINSNASIIERSSYSHET